MIILWFKLWFGVWLKLWPKIEESSMISLRGGGLVAAFSKNKLTMSKKSNMSNKKRYRKGPRLSLIHI